MPELVLYGIRELAKQLLGTILDIEVDHSDCRYKNGTTEFDENVLTNILQGDNKLLDLD